MMGAEPLADQTMQPTNPAESNGNKINSVAEVLRQESERLRQLAEECKKREEYEA